MIIDAIGDVKNTIDGSSSTSFLIAEGLYQTKLFIDLGKSKYGHRKIKITSASWKA